MNGAVYDNTAAQMHFQPTIAQNQLTQDTSILRKNKTEKGMIWTRTTWADTGGWAAAAAAAAAAATAAAIVDRSQVLSNHKLQKANKSEKMFKKFKKKKTRDLSLNTIY